MAALKHDQSLDDSPSPVMAQESTPATDDPSQRDFTKLYRHFSRNLPLSFSLQHGTHLAAVALQNGILGSLTGVGWRGREKQLFAERVAGVIETEDFVALASNAIGLPKHDETEDEYVERSKGVFRRLLLSAFNNA
jgi:hypothetical protein